MDISKLLLAFLAWLNDEGYILYLDNEDGLDEVTIFNGIIEEFLDGYPPI